MIGRTGAAAAHPGRATGGGRSVCFCEAEIIDEHGHGTGRAMGTFRYRAPGPSPAGE